MKNITVNTIEAMSFQSNTEATLLAFLNSGFKVSYDPEKCEGKANFKGVDIEFSCGGENLYFNLNLFTKGAPDQTVSALLDVAKLVYNYQ